MGPSHGPVTPNSLVDVCVTPIHGMPQSSRAGHVTPPYEYKGCLMKQPDTRSWKIEISFSPFENESQRDRAYQIWNWRLGRSDQRAET